MIGIDLNEQFITYVIYKGCGKWYISDKEIWYLDYQKRIEEYRKIGREIKEEYIDEKFDNEKMEFLFPGMKKAAEAGVTTDGIISNERPYLDATDPDNGMKIEQGKDVSEIN